MLEAFTIGNLLSCPGKICNTVGCCIRCFEHNLDFKYVGFVTGMKQEETILRLPTRLALYLPRGFYYTLIDRQIDIALSIYIQNKSVL